MPRTSYFFPKSKQGTALGLQAGIGNFGVSIVQFVTPWIVGFSMLGVLGASQTFTNPTTKATKDVWYQNAGWVWVPLVIIGSIAAWMLLKSVPVKARGVRDQFDIFSEKHTWLMTVLYVLTFGTFAGLAAQFGLLTKNLFGDFANAPDPVKYVFLGPLVGSAARILAGPITDRLTGGRVTLSPPSESVYRPRTRPPPCRPHPRTTSRRSFGACSRSSSSPASATPVRSSRSR